MAAHLKVRVVYGGRQRRVCSHCTLREKQTLALPCPSTRFPAAVCDPFPWALYEPAGSVLHGKSFLTASLSLLLALRSVERQDPSSRQ